MSKELHTKIQSEYSKQRERAKLIVEQRQAEAYESVNGLKDLDGQIVKLGIEAAKRVLVEPDKAEMISIEVEKQISLLKSLKARLLKEAGYPEGYLEISYKCKDCQDTGILGGKQGTGWCTCYRQLLIDGLFDESGLVKDKMACFDKSNDCLFCDEVDAKRFDIEISPRENYSNIKCKCLNFTEEGFFQLGGKGLLFSGQTGTGKTFIAECIAQEIILKGQTVAFVSAAAMFDRINEAKIASFEDEQDDYFGLLKEANLLIIDDLGTETPSEAKLSNLLQLLNVRARLDQMSPHKTIISTNLTLQGIRNRYDDRIMSRIIGGFLLFKFGGEDLRIITR